ncbi:DEAD/DEAH box helicase [Chryseobacterium sp. JM1]|uniref:DEAD/DEAH box helicase n=1 Tax=Chryseobacterium sp. JM1 TaxID=1233950 RepID=UPI0004E78CB6|nr:DEAD/DEAH box helicase [Chryseobacterium sp. JM1]KFF21044.1 hypothetical protein IW22_12150 [Chryseobacterium sp. JM1]
MEKDIQQLRNLRNNKDFQNIFQKLCLNKELNIDEKEFILKCALLFFQLYDSDKRYSSFFKIGYYIILKYCLSYNTYQPLYDISIQLGFYPIIGTLLKLEKEASSLKNKNVLLDIFTYTFFKKDYELQRGYIESFEQNNSRKKIINHDKNEIAYIAPTSYGKSSIIKEYIKINKPKKVAVIVPTKSLLVQTYLDLKELSKDYKLVLHDEMYNGEENFIGILTQERATRILNKNAKHCFDILFIDEAHNILRRDVRSYILARVVQLNYKRNNNHKIIYLSPLIESSNNLKIIKTSKDEISVRKINHDFKSFELFHFTERQSFFFDRFSGERYLIDTKLIYIEYIKKNLLRKNFFYQNKPPLIEQFAEYLYRNLDFLRNEDYEIMKISEVLKKEVHKDFKLIKFLQKGIIYLHGKIPNIIKEYIESKYKEIDSIKYLIANKVVLEGINMPIETIFITNNRVGRKNINYNDLINLIGRANRLNFIFKNGNIDKLISKIHFLDHDKFQGKNSMKSTLEILNKEKVRDTIENPLSQNYDIENLQFSGENKVEKKEKQKLDDKKLNDFSDFILEEPKNKFEKIKRYCIENSITNYYKDINLGIDIISENIETYKFNTEDKIVDIIFNIFIKNQAENIADFEIARLNEEKARNYYNNYIYVTQHLHLNQRIISTKDYFEKKSKTDDPYLYIGVSYGELTSEESGRVSVYNDDKKRYQQKVYVNLSVENVDLINLAIVKLKIEEDFVGYKLTQLISFLNDFKIITNNYYLKIIYGTTDETTINLVRFGLSISCVSELIKDDQISNLLLDRNGNLSTKNSNKFEKYLLSKPELFKFEIKKYLN